MTPSGPTGHLPLRWRLWKKWLEFAADFGAERRDFVEELSREDVKALAGEVLEALGVEKVELDEEERQVLDRALEKWRKGKTQKTQKKDEGL